MLIDREAHTPHTHPCYDLFMYGNVTVGDGGGGGIPCCTYKKEDMALMVSLLQHDASIPGKKERNMERNFLNNACD